jgi:hypothetical protein
MQSKLDFLRLATWDTAELAFLTSHLMQTMDGGFEHAKWLQYKGWKKDGIFIGHGEQKGKLHGIVNISGYKSDTHYANLLDCETFYCTRLDVQITIPQPHDVLLPEIYERIRDFTKASLIQSDENDTLYLGARTSEIFTRLYEKVLDKKYLRLEFEIKGGRSRSAWRALRNGATTDEIFSYYLQKSALPVDIIRLFEFSGDGETEHAMREEIRKDDENTLKWLQSIDGAVMKALSNHTIGEQVEIILAGWCAYAGNLDRMNEEE